MTYGWRVLLNSWLIAEVLAGCEGLNVATLCTKALTRLRGAATSEGEAFPRDLVCCSARVRHAGSLVAQKGSLWRLLNAHLAEPCPLRSCVHATPWTLHVTLMSMLQLKVHIRVCWVWLYARSRMHTQSNFRLMGQTAQVFLQPCYGPAMRPSYSRKPWAALKLYGPRQLYQVCLAKAQIVL